MRRRLLIAAMFLLAGAVVNVAVAWGCAMWQPWPHTFGDYREGFTRQGQGSSDWMSDTSRTAGFVRVHSSWMTGGSKFTGVEPEHDAEEILPAWAGFARPTGSSQQNTNVQRILDARGWPMISLWAGVESIGFPGPTGTISNVVSVTNGFLFPAQRVKPFTDWGNLRILPLSPIWPGFAVNTIFYAAVLWLLIPGPFALRRFIRVKRGLCHACAYPAGKAAVCSECGNALPKRAEVAT